MSIAERIKRLKIAAAPMLILRCGICHRSMGYMAFPLVEHLFFCAGCASTANAKLKEEFGIRRF